MAAPSTEPADGAWRGAPDAAEGGDHGPGTHGGEGGGKQETDPAESAKQVPRGEPMDEDAPAKGVFDSEGPVPEPNEPA